MKFRDFSGNSAVTDFFFAQLLLKNNLDSLFLNSLLVSIGNTVKNTLDI